MSYIPTSLSISKSVITSSPSPVLARRLYALYKSALYVMLAALNLILDCLGLKLAVAVYGGLLTRRPLPCILCVPCDPYVPYISAWSSDITRRRFWPVKA